MLRALRTMAVIVLAVACAGTASGQGRPDEVAVVVNGEPISTWEVGLLVPEIRAEVEAQNLKDPGDLVIRTAIQRAIDGRLLAQESVKRGFEPNQERIESKMKSLAERAGGRAALEAELIKSGVTYEQLKATVVQSDLAQSLVENEIVSGIEVSEEDVAAYYAEHPELFTSEEKVHARHILLKVPKDAGPEQRAAVRKRAEVAQARALSGENFAALAMELSEGPNAARGGDLGFNTRGQMIPSFDEAVWKLKAGEISEVVESHLGYHIIKVDEYVEGKVVTLDEARPLITDLLRQQRMGAELAEFISGLRETAEISEPQ